MRYCPTCHLPYPEPGRTRCIVDGTPLVEREGGLEGTLLSGRYRIERVLGEGGMAQVYRATAAPSGAAVAVKVMHAHLASDPALRERFRREAKNAMALSHENVIEMLDAGEMPSGEPYLVMELLEGETLRDRIAAGGPMPLSTFVPLARDIARGLARAHDLGIVHRDLKPENVFLCPRGGRDVAKIVDFGIARARGESHLTQAGALVGTPAYIAPERVHGHESGEPSDLYSLGIVLYEMLAGRTPFVADEVPSLLLQQLQAEPPPLRSLAPSCPPVLEELVLRLLDKQPERRPVDAHQVVRELEALARSVPGLAPPDDAAAVAEPARPTIEVASEVARWQARASFLEDMLRRAHPSGAPRGLAAELEALRHGTARLSELTEERAKASAELEALTARVRADRERLGYAVHVLAADLSAEREAAAALKKELGEREVRAADLELQIAELRKHLADHERQADGAGAAVVQRVQRAGAAIEQEVGDAARATRALVAALRESPACAGIAIDFE